MSTAKPYRVIQWATGGVGKIALKNFIENPFIELVGVWVNSPAKVGKDAGELAEVNVKTNVLATNDIDAILALDADCILFSPAHGPETIDLLCRMLRSGKNVISSDGPYYHFGEFSGKLEKLDQVCKETGKSYHGAGVHPGFAGDLLPVTVLRAANRVDHIHVYEVVDFLASPNPYIEYMGFGLDPEELRKNPRRTPDAHIIFAQSMQFLVDALGAGKIEDIKTTYEMSTATSDIKYPNGTIPKGTVAGQHWGWTAICDGKPLVTYHSVWFMGDQVEPKWDYGVGGYKIVFEGDPGMVLDFQTLSADGKPGYQANLWPATMAFNVVPAVCDAKPGVLTHWDLGVVKPKGLVRPSL